MKSLTLKDGRALAWREGGAGDGVPLVLLHGWTLSSAAFSEVLADLGQDRPVLAPDLRGHGHSDHGPGYGLAGFATDLVAWLEAMNRTEIDLLGWSLGGQIALQLVLGGQIQVRRLVLVAATPCFVARADWPHGLPEGQVRAMARNLARAYEPTLSEFFRRQFAGEDLPPQRLRELARFAVRAAPLTPAAVALEALETLRRVDLRPRLGEVGCPVLIHQGQLDGITLPGAAAALATSLPRAQLHLEPGVGHAPFFSRPGDAVRRWQEFLK